MEYAKELGKEVSVTDYLVWGGFPNRFEFQNTMELIGNIYDNENALGMIVKQAYFDRKSMKPCDTCAEGNQADLQSNINRNGRIGERRNRKGKLAQSGR